VIINDIDVGGAHPFAAPQVGQVIGDALIEGSRTIVWPRGRTVEKQDVTFWATAWQGSGGQAAGSFLALRYLLRQMEQMAGNPDLQPVYIQWAGTAQAGQYNVTTPHDGWYVIESVQPDYENFVVGGWVKVRMSVQMVASANPSSLGLLAAGAALSTSYSATAQQILAFPVGAANLPSQTTRTGGEGVIPLSTFTGYNPMSFTPPGSVAGLFTGGCRVWDTINTGSNPVPVAGGTYVNANWVEVKGTQHDFAGDCVVTNGLQLHLYQVGQSGLPTVYLWNTSLGTPTWQQIGSVQYQDGSSNTGTLRSLDLGRVGLQEVRVRVRASTSGGHWTEFRNKLQAGCYHTYVEAQPLTQNMTNQLALVWSSAAVYATGFTDSASSTTFPSNLATTTVSGYAAAQGSASGSPIFGWLYQNAPTTAQGRLSTTSLFGYGDSVGPLQGSFKLYGFFVVPYSGAVVLATARGVVAPIFQQFLFDKTTRWVRG
jgi:hypothetical protein